MGAIELTLPAEFRDRLKELLSPDHFDQVWETFAQPKYAGFRVNPLKSSFPDVATSFRQSEIPWQTLDWYSLGGYVEPTERARLLQCSLVANGGVYVQNPSSMVIALAMEAQPGEQVLDLAAAPGGKATLLAACMKNEGYLAAVEPIRKRFFQLRSQLQLAGVENARTFLADGRSIGSKTPDRFDRVLLDAPCSGEARFRENDPTTWCYWSLRKIREQSRKQRGLLLSAIRALRPGGTLIYATCSFAPEENEVVVDFALRKLGPAVELASLDLPIPNITPGVTHWQGRSLDPSLAHAKRILPTQLHDGAFLARLTKATIDVPVFE